MHGQCGRTPPRERPIPIETCRRVWRALLPDREPMSIDDLSILTDDEPAMIVRYLDLLTRYGRTAMTSVKHLDTGDTIPLFRLVNRTGPKAPHIDHNGRFGDPNISAPATLPEERAFDVDMPARIRTAASKFDGEFFVWDLRNAVIRNPSEQSAYKSAQNSLVDNGELVVIKKNKLMKFHPNPLRSPALYYLRDRAECEGSIEITPTQLKSAIGLELHGRQFPAMMRQLAAEGYLTSVLRQAWRPELSVYRIRKRSGGKVADA